MMTNKNIPFELIFQLNDQQYLKAVGVPRTDMCIKEWAVCSAECYSGVGESWGLSAFGVYCLQLDVFNCLNCEVGDSKLLRY